VRRTERRKYVAPGKNEGADPRRLELGFKLARPPGEIEMREPRPVASRRWQFGRQRPWVFRGSTAVPRLPVSSSLKQKSALLVRLRPISDGRKVVRPDAWALMAGFGAPISKAYTLDFGYRYIDLGKIEFAPGIIDPAGTSYDGLAGKLRAHEFFVGVRF